MNKSFVVFDKNSNLQKSANIIVKFNFEDCDYLIYSIDENNDNGQIFVSKLILNSEGKYFIDSITDEEKKKLSNLVYNIVIVLPSEESKGDSFKSLKNSFCEKFSFVFSSDIPEIGVQEYYSDCSIAITSKLLIDSAIKLYDDYLINTVENVIDVPTWTAPTEVTAPVEASVVDNTDFSSVNVPVQDVIPSVELNTNVVEPVPTVAQFKEEVILPVQNNVVQELDNASNIDNDIQSEHEKVSTLNVDTNPQLEKLAVVSDPSLGVMGVNVSNGQPNFAKHKNAGFASNKYVIIGSICIVLAIAVVIGVYFLITNMNV